MMPPKEIDAQALAHEVRCKEIARRVGLGQPLAQIARELDRSLAEINRIVATPEFHDILQEVAPDRYTTFQEELANKQEASLKARAEGYLDSGLDEMVRIAGLDPQTPSTAPAATRLRAIESIAAVAGKNLRANAQPSEPAERPFVMSPSQLALLIKTLKEDAPE